MHKLEYKYPTGIKVRDKYSGVEGIITMIAQRINGSIQYSVQPRAKEDSTYRPDPISVDEGSIEVLEADWKEPEVEFIQEFKFETGDNVMHVINGFKGIITSRAIHANQCIFYGIEGKLNKEGKMTDQGAWEIEIELIDKGLNKKGKAPLERKRTGGPDRNYPMPD